MSTFATLLALPTAALPFPDAEEGRGLAPDDRDKEYTIPSPTGTLTVRLILREGRLLYALHETRTNRELIAPSRIALAVEGAAALDGPFSITEFVTKAETSVRRETPYGDRIAPTLRYNERLLTVQEIRPPHRSLTLELRLFENALAFRLVVPKPLPEFATVRERIEFALPNEATVYESLGSEDEFRPTPVVELKPLCWLPLTARTAPDGAYLCLLEVDDTAEGAPQTLISPADKQRPNVLITEPRGNLPVPAEMPFRLPWRVIVYGETPGKLLENNAPLNVLAPPSELPPMPPETSWIRPGKAIREVTLSTSGGLACIDFAAKNGLQYVLYDAGWYGHEYDDASDARRVSLDPDRIKNQPDHEGLDLRRVIAYGKERGIGIFLYVNRRALERQLPELAPLYQSWGVAGIKFGFVNVGPAAWTRWLREAVAICARHRLLVDIHDSYRPTGLSHRFPNLLTQEGIRGNEHMPTPRHNCTLPFTRFVSGPADYTVCYRFPRLQTTDAHQMALSVICYSPLQLLYWYSRPSEYENLPELAFFAAVPTVWDETRVLSGEIGEYAVIARRRDRTWFVGGITNETPRTLTIPLDFLSPGIAYSVRRYEDRRSASNKADLTLQKGVSRIQETSQTVKSGDAPLRVSVAAGGGIALWVMPNK